MPPKRGESMGSVAMTKGLSVGLSVAVFFACAVIVVLAIWLKITGDNLQAHSEAYNSIFAELNKTREAKIIVSAERDRILVDLDEVSYERDRILAERDRLYAEVNQLSAKLEEKTSMLIDVSFASGERLGRVTELLTERDRLYAEVNQLSVDLRDRTDQISRIKELEWRIETLMVKIATTKINEKTAIKDDYKAQDDDSVVSADESSVIRLERYLVSASQRFVRQKSNQVVPVYFVPSDVAEDTGFTEAISRSLAVIQAWYADHLDGRTFSWAPVVTVRGDQPRDYYIAQDIDRGPQANWGPVMKEIYAKGVVRKGGGLLMFIEGGGAFAGANGDNPEFAVAALGDAAISAIQGRMWGEWIGVDYQRGAIAHELGHMFGMEDVQEGTIMAPSYYMFPKIGLTPKEISFLLSNNPFIN